MRELLIIRHAVAEQRDRRRYPDDDQRPLTAGGKKRFRQAARGLRQWIEPPDEMLCSSLRRARQTARILQKEAGFPEFAELVELRPQAATADLIAAVRRRPARRIAVIGHEPSLGRLLAELLSEDRLIRAPLKKGGVALVGFPGRVEAGKGRLLAFVPPRLLRAAR